MNAKCPYISVQISAKEIDVVTTWAERKQMYHRSIYNAADDIYQRMCWIGSGLPDHWYLQMMNTQHLLVLMTDAGEFTTLVVGTRTEVYHALKVHLQFIQAGLQ